MTAPIPFTTFPCTLNSKRDTRREKNSVLLSILLYFAFLNFQWEDGTNNVLKNGFEKKKISFSKEASGFQKVSEAISVCLEVLPNDPGVITLVK